MASRRDRTLRIAARWLALALGVFAFCALARELMNGLIAGRPALYAWSGTIFYALAALLLIVAFAARGRPEVPLLPKAWTSREWKWLAFLLVLVEVNYGGELIYTLLGKRPAFAAPSASFAINLAIAAPLVEEVLFRGYTIDELARQSSGSRRALIAAAVVSALCFALFHLGPIGGPYASPLPPLHLHFAFGLVMALSRYKLGSLLPGMLMHSFWNIL